eukprot:ctg_4286.g621
MKRGVRWRRGHQCEGTGELGNEQVSCEFLHGWMLKPVQYRFCWCVRDESRGRRWPDGVGRSSLRPDAGCVAAGVNACGECAAAPGVVVGGIS